MSEGLFLGYCHKDGKYGQERVISEQLRLLPGNHTTSYVFPDFSPLIRRVDGQIREAIKES